MIISFIRGEACLLFLGGKMLGLDLDLNTKLQYSKVNVAEPGKEVLYV